MGYVTITKLDHEASSLRIEDMNEGFIRQPDGVLTHLRFDSIPPLPRQVRIMPAKTNETKPSKRRAGWKGISPRFVARLAKRA